MSHSSDHAATHPMPSASPAVRGVLDSLPDEALIGQLLCVYQRGPEVGTFLDQLERDGIMPGAFFLAGGTSSEGTLDRVMALNGWSAVPPLTAANLESGSSTFALDGELVANPMQVAASGDPHFGTLLGQQCALLARQMGLTWAFAPVVDVTYNHVNPITSVRAFGQDPDLVRDHGTAFLTALQAGGVAACAKHWPGDGVDDRDQHLVTSVNHLEPEEWHRGFGSIYRAVIDAGVHTVMAGHVAAPGLLGWDHQDAFLPATQNRALLQGLLRERLGFDGLIVSDNTLMAGFSRVMPRDEAVVTAISAGCDMLLGADFTVDDYRALSDAVEKGTLSRRRLVEAVSRVLTLKEKLSLLDGAAQAPVAQPEPGWRTELARASVTLTKDVEQTLPITADRYPSTLVYVLGDQATFYQPAEGLADRFADGLRERGVRVTLRRVPGERRTPRGERDVQREFDLIIYFANVPFSSTSNSTRIEWSYPQGPEAPRFAESRSVLVSVADPYHLQDLPSVGTAVNGYTPSGEVVDAIVASLTGEAPWRGKSPVDPFCGHVDAQVLKPRLT